MNLKKKISDVTSTSAASTADQLQNLLSRLEQPLPSPLPHMDCRGGLTQFAAQLLKNSRNLWLVSSWEMAYLDFIAVTISHLKHSKLSVYLLDFDNYVRGSDPLVAASSIFGTTIQRFCESINSNSPNYIILKINNTSADRDLYNEARIIGEHLKKSCQSSYVITISPNTPDFFSPSLVLLTYLEEAECNRYIYAHPLGKYVTNEEIESSTIYNFTGGAPSALDLFLKLRQHDDFLEIQRTGLRTKNPASYYPRSLAAAINSLDDHHPEALELLLVLAVFPMGESAHAVRYIQPKRRLHGKSAVILEEMGLVYQVSLRSDSIGVFEPHKIIIVHRLVREYISDIYLQQSGYVSKFEHIQAAISLYFGENWRNQDYKLKGNFIAGKIRHNAVTSGNSRSLLLTLLCFADDEALNDNSIMEDTLKLISFYLAKLSNSTNYKCAVDLSRDIWDILVTYSHKPAAQEAIYSYLMALRMRESHEQALKFSACIVKPHSTDLDFRLKTERAYCYLALGDKISAKILADEVSNECKSSTLMHAKYISIRTSNHKNKTRKLESLVKESRARGAVRLSNFIKAHLLNSIGDLVQRCALFKKAAEEALADGDGLNYVRNTIKYCELKLENGTPLNKSDISHMEEAYRLNYGQRLTSEFKRTSNILWQDSINKRDLDRMLELFARGSQVFQILKLETEEEKYLTDLLIALQGRTSYKLDARLRYAFVRALELELLSFDKISRSLETVIGDDLKIPTL